MYKKISLLTLATFIVFMTGCAYTTVEHFRMPADKTKESKNEGVRYYENAPFILVYSTKGHYSSEFLWLPDVSSISSAEPTEFFASSQLHLTLKGGVLTTGQSVGDSTKIASAIIDTAQKLAVAAAKASAAANEINVTLAEKSEEKEIRPRIYLYRLGTDNSGDPVLFGDTHEISIVEKN